MPVKGVVQVDVIDDSGRVFRSYSFDNLVTDTGRKLIRDRFIGASVVTISQIAIGTGTTPVTASDTAMEAQVLAANIAVTSHPDDYSVKYQLLIAKSEGNGNDITEYGLLDSDGNLFSHVVNITPIKKDATKSIRISWTLTFLADDDSDVDA